MAGRKSKFTKETKDKIISALEVGASIQMACDSACIGRTTFYGWMKQGEEQDRGPYRTFLNKVNEASATGGIYMLQLITVAAEKDWKAAAWKLERRWGYNRDGAAAQDNRPAETPVLSGTPLQILQGQAIELKASMQKAEASQSWQAYAALQRQFLSVITQIRQIEAEEGGADELEGLTDEQLLQEITAAIISLPPILRQRLETSVKDLNNVIHIGGEK